MPKQTPLNERVAKLEAILDGVEKHLLDIKEMLKQEHIDSKQQIEDIKRRFDELDEKYDARYTKKWVEKWLTTILSTVTIIIVGGLIALVSALNKIL
jgi:hypothetical protein